MDAVLPGPRSTRIANTQLVFHGRDGLRLEEGLVALRGNVVRIEAAGICGTDLHILDGRVPVPVPIALGHEIVGIVERLESRDDLTADGPLAEGDRVLVAPGVDCGRCAGCRTGGTCDARELYGLSKRWDRQDDSSYGGFSRYVTLMPNTRLYKLPGEMALERCVLGEPLACCVRALQTAVAGRGVPFGRPMVILGAGVVGACTALLGRLAGADVVVVDRDERRLRLMRDLDFATVHLDAERDKTSSADITDRVRGAFGGKLAEFVVECTGVPEAMNTGLSLLAANGRLVVFGNFGDSGVTSVRPSTICRGNIEIVGTSQTFPPDTAAAVSLLNTRVTVPFERLVTSRFDLADHDAAFAHLRRRDGMKPMFVCSTSSTRPRPGE